MVQRSPRRSNSPRTVCWSWTPPNAAPRRKPCDIPGSCRWTRGLRRSTATVLTTRIVKWRNLKEQLILLILFVSIFLGGHMFDPDFWLNWKKPYRLEPILVLMLGVAKKKVTFLSMGCVVSHWKPGWESFLDQMCTDPMIFCDPRRLQRPGA